MPYVPADNFDDVLLWAAEANAGLHPGETVADALAASAAQRAGLGATFVVMVAEGAATDAGSAPVADSSAPADGAPQSCDDAGVQF